MSSFEIIDRILSEAGTLPLPPGSIDPGRAASAHADSFLGQSALCAHASEVFRALVPDAHPPVDLDPPRPELEEPALGKVAG